MSVIGIADAYRAVPIHPDDRIRQGLSWQFTDSVGFSYMIDNRLCMGLSSSPYIFSTNVLHVALYEKELIG